MAPPLNPSRSAADCPTSPGAASAPARPAFRATATATAWAITLAAVLVLLPGCAPAPEPPAEAAARALSASGGRSAQVQMQDGRFQATLTQADGQPSEVSVGGGSVHPADFGVPWYPGATADPQRSSRLGNAQGQVVTVVLRAPAPLETVAAFYRQRLAEGEGRAMRESAIEGGGVGFVLADDAAGAASQVRVQPVGDGVEIALLTTRRAPR